VQNVNNLFGIFNGRNKVQPARDAAVVRHYITPFVAKVVHTASPLRKVYWVGAPVTGRVSKEVQDFVLEQLRAAVGNTGTVIDSRALISYPYHHLEPDKEHFIGPQMDEWADHVFEFIQKDLAAHPLSSSRLVAELGSPAGENGATTPPAENLPLVVRGKLVFKSEPIKIEALLPYQESLVTFVYEVKKVLHGQYAENQILVARPAHIGLKPQPLDKNRIGKTYKLRLLPLRGTPWNVAKCKDDSGQIDLEPYITVEDEAKFPGATH
jgi:hypothetical protein